MEKNMKIPKRFKLFGTTMNIVWDNKRMNDVGAYGSHDYATCEITLSDKEGIDDLAEDRIMDTFYHERTHAILDAMNEVELSKNEKFVDVFSKLLRQAIESEEF